MSYPMTPRERNAFAAHLRLVAVKMLSKHRVHPNDVEDLAQIVTVKVMSRVEAGDVRPGLEVAYTMTAAKRRAIDWHIAMRPVRRRTSDLELEDAAEIVAAPCEFEALAEAEEQEERHAVVRAAVVGACVRYRVILEDVYVRGIPIDVLAAAEVQRDLAAGVVAFPDVARRRARDRVDKVLGRARDWVRSRVLPKRAA